MTASGNGPGDVKISRLHTDVEDVRNAFGQTTSLVIKYFVIPLIAFVLLYVAAACISATHDNSIIISPFRVDGHAPDIAMDGEIAAAHFFDQLQQVDQIAHDLQVQKGSAIVSRSRDLLLVEPDLAKPIDIRVEIPHTGVSIDGLDTFLRQRLGHQRIITGDLVVADGKPLLTVRMDNGFVLRSKDMAAGSGDFPKSVIESVYANLKPALAANMLISTDQSPARNAKAAQLLDKLLSSAGSRRDKEQDAWANWVRGNLILQGDHGDLAKAATYFDAAIRVNHHFVPAYKNLQWGDDLQGHDGMGLEHEKQASAAVLPVSKDFRSGEIQSSEREIKVAIEDYKGAFRDAAHVTNPTYIDQTNQADEDAARRLDYGRAQDLARAHDPIEAQILLKNIKHKFSPPWAGPVPAEELYENWGDPAMPQFFIDIDRGDFKAAELFAQKASDQALARKGDLLSYDVVWFKPWLAYAQASAGDLAAAINSIKETPADCYLCIRVKGFIAFTQRRWNDADADFTQASEIGRALPFAYVDLGKSKLAQGYPDQAIKYFKLAHRVGPHDADPLELWGEALLRQHRYSDAIRKFDEAAAFAPHWGRLHLAQAVAYAHTNNAVQARLEDSAAHSFGISPNDRKELE